MSSGKETPRKICRAMKTAFFLVTMIASLLSLLLFTAPLLLIVTDTLIPWALFYALTPFRSMQSLAALLGNYDFRSSLVDIPLISVGRSLVILCVYSLCDGRGLSYGPYVGTTVMCSVASVSVVVLKACFYGGGGSSRKIGGGLAYYHYVQHNHLNQGKLHHDVEGYYGVLLQSTGMRMMVVSSVALALGHIAVAYRTRRRERKKLGLFRLDSQAVFVFKSIGGLPGVCPSSSKGTVV